MIGLLGCGVTGACRLENDARWLPRVYPAGLRGNICLISAEPFDDAVRMHVCTDHAAEQGGFDRFRPVR
jgi:hypothetical protein